MSRMLRLFSLCLLIAGVSSGSLVLAHTPAVDSDLEDWCIGAFSNTFQGGGRTEDSAVTLTCGNCSASAGIACTVNGDCPGGESCVALGSKTEVAFWDDRKDGAVNDLATVAMTTDADNLYIAAELWVDPDPVSLPFGEIALDVKAGGLNTWWDPNNALGTPGHCSAFTDRACTTDDDCNFCMLSTEPLGDRVRTCGSGCDPDIGDSCNVSQTCEGLGTPGLAPNVGASSSPAGQADYLIVFDFSRWLLGASGPTLLLTDVGGTWTAIGQFEPAVNPGASGGSGGPPGSVEQLIPLSSFGGDLVDGQDFTYTMIIARGDLSLDYTPDGAIEDVLTEKVAGTTTATQNSCCEPGIATTSCEVSDGSSDAFFPRPANTAGGRAACLTLDRGTGASVTLEWCPSCSSLDNDYAVYEGEIGNWYSHVQIAGQCSTAGATTTTFDASAGNRYYLVTPSDASNEGSYGADSADAERPTAATGCKAQALGNCP